MVDAFALLAMGLGSLVSSGSDPRDLTAENARTIIDTIIGANFTGVYFL